MENTVCPSDRPHIVAIDPGKTTGICIIDPENLDHSYHYELDAADKPSSVAIGCEFSEYLSMCSDSVTALVIEDWEDRQNKFTVNAKHAAGPIGVLQWLAHTENVPVVLQRPFERSRITDFTLRDSGLWWPHGKGHARQAMKHGLTYLLRQHHRGVQNRLFPRTV